MTNQAKNNNLSYLIDPTFTKINRLLVLSFENEEDRTSFFKNYLPNVKIKDFRLLINGPTIFFVIEKSEETIFELSQNSATIVKFFATNNNGNTITCEFMKGRG